MRTTTHSRRLSGRETESSGRVRVRWEMRDEKKISIIIRTVIFIWRARDRLSNVTTQRRLFHFFCSFAYSIFVCFVCVYFGYTRLHYLNKRFRFSSIQRSTVEDSVCHRLIFCTHGIERRFSRMQSNVPTIRTDRHFFQFFFLGCCWCCCLLPVHLFKLFLKRNRYTIINTIKMF